MLEKEEKNGKGTKDAHLCTKKTRSTRPGDEASAFLWTYLFVSVLATLVHAHVSRSFVRGGVARWHLVSNCIVYVVLQIRNQWMHVTWKKRGLKSKSHRQWNAAWRCVLSQCIIQIRIYTDGLLYRSMPVVFSLAVRNLSAFVLACLTTDRSRWQKSGMGCIGCLLLAYAHREGLPIRLLIVQSSLHFASAMVGSGGMDWSEIDLEDYVKKTSLWNVLISLPITYFTGPHQPLSYWPGWIFSLLGASSGMFFLLACKHADVVRAMHVASLSKAVASLLAWDLREDVTDTVLTMLGGFLTLGTVFF